MRFRPLAFSVMILAAAVSVSCGTEAEEPIDIEIPSVTSAVLPTTTSAETVTTAAKTTLTDKKTTVTVTIHDENNKTTTVVTTEKASDEVQTTEPPADQETQQEEPAVEPETEKPNETEQTKSFSIDDLLADTDTIIKSIGSPDEKYTASACTKNGSDITIYRYQGLEIQSYKNDNGKDCICRIFITSDSYTTSDGVKVGSSRNDADSAWGSGTEEGKMTYYFFGQKEIDVEFDGDTVSSISFYYPV